MSKFLNKNSTISEKCQNSSTKMIPFLKRVKIPQQKWYHFSQKRAKISQQKWYHFRKGSKILNKNHCLKMVKITQPFQAEKGKIPQQNGTISEKGQNSSTKMIPFQKTVKIPQQKWYHFWQKRVKIAQQKWYHFRKWSKIVNKNGTISEKGQKSSTKTVPF